MASFKYQLLLLISIMMVLTNTFFSIIISAHGWNETDNVLLSILLLLPDIGPFIWAAIMAGIGFSLSEPKLYWSNHQIKDRKALMACIIISSLVFSWDLLRWGWSLEKLLFGPDIFEWDPRSPKSSLFYFLCRLVLVIFLAFFFLAPAFAAFMVPRDNWDNLTKVKGVRNPVVRVENEDEEVDYEESCGDRDCLETNWQERELAILDERYEKWSQEKRELLGRRKSV